MGFHAKKKDDSPFGVNVNLYLSIQVIGNIKKQKKKKTYVQRCSFLLFFCNLVIECD